MIKYPEQILVRLEKGQNDELKKDANKYDLTVSSYIRLKLFGNGVVIFNVKWMLDMLIITI